ncbi:hypothetical protein [Streptomyces sp. FXY-T5]|uniref:hypothetical protein n=1 Tax=Streptomyces sp. FXY-T5 TaxID=3064901 RepID=UPI0027D2F03A|nr:hypothetical protein [Streptomyces sp. FXY-T5]WMD06408.1 hypothetical protein Q7C01_19340 [Streptomyces sp. FXY-T5]
MSETRDVVIIGFGPAGDTAARCTARARLSPRRSGAAASWRIADRHDRLPDEALGATPTPRAAAVVD